MPARRRPADAGRRDRAHGRRGPLASGKRSTSPLFRRAREGLALVTEEKSIFMGLTTRENLILGRGREVDEPSNSFPS